MFGGRLGLNGWDQTPSFAFTIPAGIRPARLHPANSLKGWRIKSKIPVNPIFLGRSTMTRQMRIYCMY